jgi:UDP-glucuronate decarboxylase
LLEDHGTSREEERKARVPLAVGLKSKRQKRVLVTGGAGFVGSHLVDRLIERGDNVIVIDNYFTGRKENVIHHIGNPNFELIRHDVVEPILLEVDQIYHLACPASPVHYKFNPVKTIISFFRIFFLAWLLNLYFISRHF